MSNIRREELIATIAGLLKQLAEAEAAPRKETAAPEAPSSTVEMLTIKECCDTVKGLNEYTVRQLVTRGAIPFVRCGQGKRGKILIPKAALLSYFSGGSTMLQKPAPKSGTDAAYLSAGKGKGGEQSA